MWSSKAIQATNGPVRTSFFSGDKSKPTCGLHVSTTGTCEHELIDLSIMKCILYLLAFNYYFVKSKYDEVLYFAPSFLRYKMHSCRYISYSPPSYLFLSTFQNFAPFPFLTAPLAFPHFAIELIVLCLMLNCPFHAF